MSRHCCACDRKIPFRESVFYFPTNSDRRAQWLNNSGLENIKRLSEKQLMSRSLCSVHFTDKCFTSKEKIRLLKNAIPDQFENGRKDCQQCESSVRRVLIRDLTSRMTGMEFAFGIDNKERNEKEADGPSDSSRTKVVRLDPMDVQSKDPIDNLRYIEADAITSPRIYNDISCRGVGASCSTDFTSIFIKQEEDSTCQPSLPSIVQSSNEYQPGSSSIMEPGAVSIMRYPCQVNQQYLLDKNQSPSVEVLYKTVEKVSQMLQTSELNPVISEDTQTSPRIDNGKSTEEFGSSCSTVFAGIFIKQEEDSVCQPCLPSTIHLPDEFHHGNSIDLELGTLSMMQYPGNAEQQYSSAKNQIHSSDVPSSTAEKDYPLLQPSEQLPVVSKDIETQEPFNNDSFSPESTKHEGPCLLSNHVKLLKSDFGLNLYTEEDSIQLPERPSLPEIRPRLSLTDVGFEVMCSKHFLHNASGNISANVKPTSDKESLPKNSSLDAYPDVHMKGKLYQCSICMKQFFLESTMAKHMRSHKGENGYQCRICKTTFDRMYKLTAHMVIHTGGKLYECETCKKKFTFKSSLTRHISIHSGEKPYNCDICMKNFSRKSTLARHIRSHNGVKPYRCKTCKKRFAEKFTLTAHIKIHTGEKPYQCQICKKTFTFQSNLTVHVKTHNEVEGLLSTNPCFSTEKNDSLAAVSSSISTELQPSTDSSQLKSTSGNEKNSLKEEEDTAGCSAVLSETNLLEMHQFPNLNSAKSENNSPRNFSDNLTKTEKTILKSTDCSEKTKNYKTSSLDEDKVVLVKEKPYQCVICLTKFSLESEMVKHIKSHNDKNPCQCKICKKIFTQKSTLTIHMKIHTGEKPYQCKTCKKTFIYRSSLTLHNRTHNGEKPYICDMCEKTYTSKSALTAHVRTCKGEKQYQCKVCKSAFTQKYTLTVHMKIHTGEKPYSCKLCNKTFTYKSSLTLHNRTHSGDKPYMCEICEKNFSCKSGLIVHIRTHTGEKPYQCEVCQKTFSTKPVMTRHVQMHYGEKLYECPICHIQFRHKVMLSKHTNTHTAEKEPECKV